MGYHTVFLAERYQGNRTSLKCISMNPVYRRTTSVNETPTTYARKRGDFRSPVTHTHAAVFPRIAALRTVRNNCTPYDSI